MRIDEGEECIVYGMVAVRYVRAKRTPSLNREECFYEKPPTDFFNDSMSDEETKNDNVHEGVMTSSKE